MAINIRGIKSLTLAEGLKAAYGYERYPNGSHGYSLAAVEWLVKHKLCKWISRGDAHSVGVAEMTVSYIGVALLRELAAKAGPALWTDMVIIPVIKKQRAAERERNLRVLYNKTLTNRLPVKSLNAMLTLRK